MTSDTQQETRPHCSGPGASLSKLRGDMGIPRLVFLVLAFNSPLGIVAGIVPLVIAFGPGVGTPLLFLGLGALLASFAVGYSLMARTLRGPGAFYTFVTQGLGRVPGLAASFLALMTYTCGVLSILTFAGLSSENLLLLLGGPQVSWWVFSLALAAGVGVLGYCKIDLSTRVVVVLVACEVAVVLIYDAVVSSKGGAFGQLSFDSFDPGKLFPGTVATGVVFAVIAFGGFESTAIYRNEVRNPERTIPRATYLAVALIAVFYCFASWLLIQAVGQGNAVETIVTNPTGVFLESLKTYLGRVGFDIAIVLVITSSFASMVAMHNVIARYVFNLGGDRVLPGKLGRVHPRMHSPHRASLLLSTVTAGLIVAAAATSDSSADIYAVLAGISGYALVVLLFTAAVAICVYLIRRRPPGSNIWQHTIAPLTSMIWLAAVTLIVSVKLDLLTGSRTRSLAAMVLVVAVMVGGAVFALVLKRYRPQVFENLGAR